MLTSQANVKTEKASRYLQQLCKHFEHKVDVEYSAESGRITLPMGICELDAKTEDILKMAVMADSQQHLSKTKEVMANHLARFAFRENLEISWSDQ